MYFFFVTVSLAYHFLFLMFKEFRAYDSPSCSTAEIDLENLVVTGEVQVSWK